MMLVTKLLLWFVVVATTDATEFSAAAADATTGGGGGSGGAAGGQQPFQVLWGPNYDINDDDVFGTPYCPGSAARPLSNLSSAYGFTTTKNARGCGINFPNRSYAAGDCDKVVMFQDPLPGLIPSWQGDVPLNGGTPQDADMAAHLAALKQNVERVLPDPESTAIVALDLEHWGAFWGMAGSDSQYQKRSRARVASRHPSWNVSQVEALAKQEWETTARAFLETTLAEGRRLRPLTRWGIYGWPACQSYGDWRSARGVDPGALTHGSRCVAATTVANDHLLGWLWEAVDVFLPSFYAMSINASYNNLLVAGELREARRIQASLSVHKPIFFYAWYYPWDCHSCTDTPDKPRCAMDPDGDYERGCFDTPSMLASQLALPAQHGIDGVIMWGAGSDVYTATHCSGLQNYIVNTMGPMVRNVTEMAAACGVQRCSARGRCVDVVTEGGVVADCDCFNGWEGATCAKQIPPLLLPLPPPPPLGPAVPSPAPTGGGSSAARSYSCTHALDAACGVVAGGTGIGSNPRCVKCTETHAATLHAAGCTSDEVGDWCTTPSPLSDLRAAFVDVFTGGDNSSANLVPSLDGYGPQIAKTFSGPDMVFVPSPNGQGSGTLLAFVVAECKHRSAEVVVMKRSTDAGTTWGPLSCPWRGFEQYQSWSAASPVYDPVRQVVLLMIGNVTSWGGHPFVYNSTSHEYDRNTSYRSCDTGTDDFPNLDGPFAIESADHGVTWRAAGLLGERAHHPFCRFGVCSNYSAVSAQLQARGVPSTCLAVTDNSALALPPSATAPHGRLLFTMSDEHEGTDDKTDGGDVIVFTDDGGSTWQFSAALHQRGSSEGAVAMLRNGSVFSVMRHCTIDPNSTLKQCINADKRSSGPTDSGEILMTSQRTQGIDPNFRLAYAVSDDAGVNWGPMKIHADLVTPMCQADLVNTAAGTLLVSTPYSEKGRHNMSVLASDDDGATFPRQLRVWTGDCAYSAVVCGLPPPNDCGVMFDRYFEGDFAHVTFVRFPSTGWGN
jgi:hypothetical protein